MSIAFELHLTEHPTPAHLREATLREPGFGQAFSDHMVRIEYEPTRGWHDARVCARAPLQMDPATSVLHYGQAIFEGMKAFYRNDGSIAIFRPLDHARRFARSAVRIAMPVLPEETFVESLDQLVRADRDWVPRREGQTLYLRPTMIAADPYLGVRPSREYLFFVIASPGANYFANGISPLNVWVCRNYVRAAPGGTGAAKVAGNYAASLLGQSEAQQQGCEQVVWLDALERKYVEELGGMNLFLVVRDERKTLLVTPELSDTVLAGVTRASIIRLAQDRGYEVVERKIALDEWIERIRDGSLLEAIACGTAAVITPIGRLRLGGEDLQIGGGVFGPIASELRQAMLGIQYGTRPDPHGWMHIVS